MMTYLVYPFIVVLPTKKYVSPLVQVKPASGGLGIPGHNVETEPSGVSCFTPPELSTIQTWNRKTVLKLSA